MKYAGAYAPSPVSSRPWLRAKPCCGATRCDTMPTRLYPAGWRCDDHQPGNPDYRDCFAVVTGRLFDGTEFTR